MAGGPSSSPSRSFTAQDNSDSRVNSPGPFSSTTGGGITTSVSPKRNFLSKIFTRKKSTVGLHRTPTVQILGPGEDAFGNSASFSRSMTPIPVFNVTDAHSPTRADRTSSPMLERTSSTVPRRAQTPLSGFSPSPKRPKAKSSLSALASIFRSGGSKGPSQSENINVSPIRARRRGSLLSKHAGPSDRRSSNSLESPLDEAPRHSLFREPPSSRLLDIAAARKRASTVLLEAPPRSPSLAMLFEASHADVDDIFDSQHFDFPVSYTPILARQSESNTSALFDGDPLLVLAKSRSTPDLLSHAGKQFIGPNASQSPTMMSPAVLRNRASSPTSGRSSALIPQLRSPSSLSMRSTVELPAFASHSSKSKVKPVLSIENTAVTLRPHGKDSISPPRRPARQTPVGASVVARAPPVLLPAFTKKCSPQQGSIPSIPLPQASASDFNLALMPTKQSRPTTAGTFGRPQTANRPNTGVGRPDTAVSDRPFTGASTFGGGNHLHPSGRDGRMRRLSNVSLSEDEDEDNKRDEVRQWRDEFDMTSLDSPDSFKLTFNDSSMLQILKDDSGFSEKNDAPKQQTTGSEPAPPSSESPSKLPRLIIKGKQQIFRPTTADTTHLPLDLPDIDIAFDPKASLGSLGRQSSVPTLSDQNESSVESGTELMQGRSTPVVNRKTMLATVGFEESVETPKRAEPAAMARAKNAVPPFDRQSTSFSSSLLSKILLRKTSDQLVNTAGGSRQSYHTGAQMNEIGKQSSEIDTQVMPPKIVATMTENLNLLRGDSSSFAPTLGKGQTSDSPKLEISTQHDPYASSYFPPYHQLFPPASPYAASLSSASVSAISDLANENDMVKRLIDALERETIKREALEYALASTRESTGADLRRADLRIRELQEENSRLRDMASRPGSRVL